MKTGDRRWWVLIALALSVLIVGIDLTVLNVALPTIAPALHASTTDLQWFVDAYSLVLAAAVLPMGQLGDRFGRKRLLMVGLAVFGIASAFCAYSPDSGVLIATRAVLGLAAAAVLPLAMSVLPVMFTEQERPKAVAAVVSATMLGFPLGPVLGGWLLTHFWWGSVFLINMPIVLLALAAVALLMPESRNPRAPRLDPLGVALTSAGLVGLTYGVIEAGSHGWGDAGTLASLAAGALLLAVFVPYERRAIARGAEPLVDLALFRSAAFSWGTALATLVSFAMFGLMFAMPLYFQDVQGADAFGTGLRMLPLVGGLLVGGALAARLQERAGLAARPVVALGFVIIAGGLAFGSATTAASGTGFAAAWFALVGFGLGFALPASMNAALDRLEGERSGAGTSLITALRQVGATIGVAVLGTVLGTVYSSHLSAAPAAARQSVSAGVEVAHRLGSGPLLATVRDSFVQAMDAMLLVCSGIAAAAAIMAWLFLPARRGARRQTVRDGVAGTI
jgi:DHA2 family multidrug resistance protein-like MFS transporter